MPSTGRIARSSGRNAYLDQSRADSLNLVKSVSATRLDGRSERVPLPPFAVDGTCGSIPIRGWEGRRSVERRRSASDDRLAVRHGHRGLTRGQARLTSAAVGHSLQHAVVQARPLGNIVVGLTTTGGRRRRQFLPAFAAALPRLLLRAVAPTTTRCRVEGSARQINSEAFSLGPIPWNCGCSGRRASQSSSVSTGRRNSRCHPGQHVRGARARPLPDEAGHVRLGASCRGDRDVRRSRQSTRQWHQREPSCRPQPYRTTRCEGDLEHSSPVNGGHLANPLRYRRVTVRLWGRLLTSKIRVDSLQPAGHDVFVFGAVDGRATDHVELHFDNGDVVTARPVAGHYRLRFHVHI